MSEPELYHVLLMLMLALSGVVFAALGLVSAPYGRHERRGWGPTVPERLGWVLMESPASLLFLWIYLQGSRALEPVPLVMLALWQVHYVHRSFVYPLMMRSRPGRRMPVA